MEFIWVYCSFLKPDFCYFECDVAFLPDIFLRHDGSGSLQCDLCLCSLGYMKLWTESSPCVLNILHFVISTACRGRRRWCCSIIGVHWTVDYGEGATNVPNVLVCCIVSVFTCFKLLIDCVICARSFQHKSYFASDVNTFLCVHFQIFQRKPESVWVVILLWRSSRHWVSWLCSNSFFAAFCTDSRQLIGIVLACKDSLMVEKR